MTDEGIDIDSKDLHKQNAFSGIVLHPSVMKTSFAFDNNPLKHGSKFGIFIYCTAQSLNISFPNFVTEGGISINVRELHPLKASFPILTRDCGRSTNSRDLHPLKAEFPILTRDWGSSTDVSDGQSQNTLSSIAVTYCGIVIETSDFILENA